MFQKAIFDTSTAGVEGVVWFLKFVVEMIDPEIVVVDVCEGGDGVVVMREIGFFERFGEYLLTFFDGEGVGLGV